MFRAFANRTIVEVEKRLKDKVVVGGFELQLDNVFRQYWNTVQIAKVVATNHEELESGDIVYVHHFVSNDEHKLPVDGNYSWLENHQIYCKVKDGIVKALGDFVLVEPITYGDEGVKESESGLILTSKSANEHLERIGIVRHVGKNGKEHGLKPGDKVLFGKDCEYEMLVENKLYYRMELRDVITVLEDNVKVKV